ncbi:integrin alpha-5 [Camarhynchus parvulus]|uniref:integrin alpha-5 n=1 Tax=Geospiza parvula TaxID=87175 RepID=UPI001237AFFF|nr:integrin alpha-5 [Camarhynchus parvulus]
MALPVPLPVPLLLPLLLPPVAAFNLEASRPVVFRGAPGSFFGFALDFYLPEPRSVSILVGAPKANTSQPNVTQGGAVFHCPWPPEGGCAPIDFDHIGTRTHDFGGNSSDGAEPVEFKSLQWFGATVRAHNGSILACAPLYSWSPPKKEGGAREPVGSCFLSLGNFSKFVEYAPCRSETRNFAGQGLCGGFSAEFTQTGRVLLGGPGSFFWQGQVMSATQEQITAGNFPEYLIQEVPGQLQTRQAEPSHDDSYMGYSVAVGEFSGDTTQDFVAGVPKGNLTYGYVTILNGTNMKSLYNFSGEQMASYFGYAVAATDVNNDGLTDLLVGAPLFMARAAAAGRGRVPAAGARRPRPAPQRAAPRPPRPGPAGYNGTGGQWCRGQWYRRVTDRRIQRYRDAARTGTDTTVPGAMVPGKRDRADTTTWPWGPAGARVAGGSCSSSRRGCGPARRCCGGRGAGSPTSGARARRGSDLDGNGYPDLLVGAFGADAAVVYRGRPIVHASATLAIVPSMFNPEERGCALASGHHVSCINVTFCLNASGRHLPGPIGLALELSVDGAKAGGARRALFLGGGAGGAPPSPTRNLSLEVPNGGSPRCRTLPVFLRNESEFRDKLSPIPVSLSLALDPAVSPAPPGLSPLLSPATRTRLEAKAHIQLDCEDNVCVPDLQLEASADRRAVFLGDRNSERGVPGATVLGNFSALSCELGGGNGSGALVCDLGNPMKAGASIWGGLRFTLPHLSDNSSSVRFELQIRSKNANNSQSALVPVALAVRAATRVSVLGVSRPDVVTIPEGGWGPDPPQRLQDLGPPVEHVYEVVNEGPGAISQGTLELSCPLGHRGHPLLYVTGHEGLHNCTASQASDPLGLEREQSPAPPRGSAGTAGTALGTAGTGCPEAECFRLSCPSGPLQRQQRVTLRLSFRLRSPPVRQVVTALSRARPEAGGGVPVWAVAVVTALSRARPERCRGPGPRRGVPVWAVVLAVLLGLLLLGLLCYGLYKLGFFKRSGPYGTAMEKAQLKPQAASEA